MTTATTTPYLPAGLPAPAAYPDGLAAEFWEAAQRHELVVQQCNACANFQWGPEFICYRCLSDDLGYTRVSGRGRIYSWERAWYPVHPALRESLPYIVVLVELPDAANVRMVGNLLGDPKQEVVIGSEVEAVFEDHNDASPPYTLVQWRVLEGAE
ncbi:MAG: OB-fold domain-containing protein [Chloroflexi bacterium]|nr:OB-fold domain-containing protein [Chloroflexota bacterium]